MELSRDSLNDDALERLRQILDRSGVDYEIISHPASILSAEDGVKGGMGSLAEMAPTLVLSTERGYIAAVISGETRLSYKKIKKHLGLKNIALASPEVVRAVTGAEVGSVSLVNPGLQTIIDSRVEKFQAVYGGCGLTRHTLRITPADLTRVTQAVVFDFTEPTYNRQSPLARQSTVTSRPS